MSSHSTIATRQSARNRPLTCIEEAALLREAKCRGWKIRRIGRCLVFINAEDRQDTIVLSRQTMRWRDGYGQDLGLVSLAQCFYDWSPENAVRRLAQRRHSERLRFELRRMVAEIKRLYADEALPDGARRFVEEEERVIEDYPVIRRKRIAEARGEFVYAAIGFGERLDALLDRIPEGPSPNFDQAYNAALKMMSRAGSWVPA